MKMNLPREWQVVELGDLLKIIAGQAPPSSSYNKNKIGLPFLRVNSFNEKYPSTDTWTVHSLKECEERDILLSVAGTIGSINIADKKYSITRSIFALRVDTEKLHNLYLFYFLKTLKEKLSSFGTGSSQKIITIKTVESLRIPLPPLPIQKQIVSILEKAEKLKEMRKEADELTKDFLKAKFLEMFSQGLVKESSHVMLEDICTRITDGEHITPRRVDKGIYLLSARNVLNHQVSLIDVDFIDEEEFKKISKRIVPQLGDILVSCSGTIGRVARVKEDYRFQLVRSVALIRPDTKKLNPIYLEYFFDTNYMQMQISKSINQSSQANLFQGKIKKLKIYLPTIDRQNKFASIVKEVEVMKEYQKQSRENIKNLFNNLLQKSFKGELVC